MRSTLTPSDADSENFCKCITSIAIYLLVLLFVITAVPRYIAYAGR